MPSIKQVCNALADNQDAIELHKLLEAIRVDLAALRTTVAALRGDSVAWKAAIDRVAVDVGSVIVAASTSLAAVAAVPCTSAVALDTPAAAPAALTTTA